jgi:DNA-binding CsgD family transcriptional regulator/RecA/RadA recombinase
VEAGSATELRERRLELEALDDALRAVAAGDGRVLAIEGPAGIGKTTLIAAARERAAAAGMTVLSARGSELERDFPWGVVHQLVEPVLRRGDERERRRWFAGAAALARPLFEHAHEVGTPVEPEAQFRRRHGLYWLVANVARDRPVVVAVDDAQWADQPTVGFLRYLAARLGHLPVLLLLGFRPHREGVSPLLLEPGATVLRPQPLTVDEVEHWLLDDVGGPVEARFAAACHAATGGNPFLIRELLHEVRAEAIPPTAVGAEQVGALSPRAVMTAVLLRLAGLPPSAGALARAAAVLGEAELSVVAELAGLDDAAALEAAAGLVQAGILEPADTVRFVHPLVRSALYEDVIPAERALIHGRAAELLRDGGADVDHVAAQLVLAPRIGERWALEALSAAAWEATANGAPEVAARFLERAAIETPGDDEHFEVVLALGRAATLAGAPGATDHLRAAVDLARTPAQYARAAIKLSRTLRYAGAGGEAVELLERAAARLGEGDAGLAVRIEHELLAASTVSFAARERLADRRARWWRDASDPPASFFDRFQFAAAAVEAAGRGEPAGTVLALSDAARPETAGRDHLGRHLRLLALYAAWSVDAYDRAYALAEQILEDAREGGGAELTAVALAQRAHVSLRAGRLPAAATDAIDALQLAADLHTPPAFLLTAGASLLHVAAEQGEEPHRLAAELVDDGDSFFGRHLSHARATLDVAQGRVEEGLMGLLTVGERERAIGWDGPAHFPWRSQAALALVELGDRAEAERLVAEEVRLARAMGAPRALGIALRAAGLVAAEGGAPQLQDAVDVLAGSGADLEHARALVDCGAGLRRAGERVRGRELLRRGHELALHCGGALLAERARQELLAAGARPRRTALSGPESLTPSERRVVELAANEMTNRQIAQALYVTEKTVETHLSHAFAKLDVRSRRALADALANPVADG